MGSSSTTDDGHMSCKLIWNKGRLGSGSGGKLYVGRNDSSVGLSFGKQVIHLNWDQKTFGADSNRSRYLSPVWVQVLMLTGLVTFSFE